MYLAEITQSVTRLPGVGPAKAREFSRLGVTTIGDLLLHLPRDYENRVEPVSFAEATPERAVNTTATVVAHSYVGRPPRQILKVHIRDDSGLAVLTCFGRNFLARSLPEGKRIRVYGTFQRRFGDLQATAFEFEDADREPRLFDRILPVYPLSGKLSQHDVRTAVATAIQHYLVSPTEELPGWLRDKRALYSTHDAIVRVHRPGSVEEARRARATLVYMELFFLQLGIALRSAGRQTGTRAQRSLPRSMYAQLLAALPYRLTTDQQRVSDEVLSDLESEIPMARLLQGDVGSGKTIVALLSAIPVIEAGMQVALMAPTELLARQHADALSTLLHGAGCDVSLALLSGTVSGTARGELLGAIRTGAVDLVVGTHAVFTSEVEFRNLQYVIIDEQHRFGVLQRLALMNKARQPDLLLMTATPIPRTLALTVFGDMKVSTIRQMPPGRKPVETHLSVHDHASRVYDAVGRELAAGRQAYFVYPVIDDTGKLDLKDAEGMRDHLQREVYPEKAVGLVHSRLSDDEKQTTMEAFRAGRIDVLVATSVVEVGVDVPNATCMVIEHAERFGLAALHQLRGRVGRGSHKSYCFLVYDADLTEIAKERLKAIHRTHDGFEIAEEDLRIRGPGDIIGTQQSGYLRFRVADLARDLEVMNQARHDAFEVVEGDPALTRSANRALSDALKSARRAGRLTPISRRDELIPVEAAEPGAGAVATGDAIARGGDQ